MPNRVIIYSPKTDAFGTVQDNMSFWLRSLSLERGKVINPKADKIDDLRDETQDGLCSVTAAVE